MRERLSDPREAVAGWAARALGGGDPAADARSLRRLERIASGMAPPIVNGVGDVKTVMAATSGPLTNTSTSTWVAHLTTSLLLAAGTWTVTLLYIGTYLGDTGNTVFFSFRVSAPVVGTTTSGAASGTGRITVSAAVAGNVVSDGAVATTFTAQFQKSAGTYDTPRAETGSIFAICQRVSS